jgi:hypothetical protein
MPVLRRVDGFPLAAAAVVIFAALAASTWLLPRDLVLPALAILLVLGSFVASVIAWTIGASRRASGFSSWDLAGLLMLAGCAAAMLSEPERFLGILEGVQLAHQADPLPRDPPP